MNGWVRALSVLCALALVADSSAQELKQRQATIKGLVVRTLEDGNLSGMAIGVVATASGDASGGKISIRGTIGPQMKGALDEAERFVRLKYPELGNAKIELSFVERQSPKDGPSAGTALAVLLNALVEGYQIDPAVGITGDIAVNGEVRPIGGVTAKLKGAKADGCTICVIPKTNVPAVADLLVSIDPKYDRIELLRTLQVFSADTVPDAVAVSRADRNAQISEAMKLYAEVQATMEQRSLAGLRDPASVAKLKRVVELAPNHVTGQLALDLAQNKGPTTLTRVGSTVTIFNAAKSFWEVNNKPGGVTRTDLTKDECKRMKTELTSLQRITHADVQGLRKSMIDWIDAVDRLLSYNGPITEKDRAILTKRRDALVTELDRLKTDSKLVERMMREGY